MGAKTGMALALQYPDLVKMLVSVDNAPVHAYLSSDFHRYVRAMKGIETRNITTHSEADQILQAEEKVTHSSYVRKLLTTRTFQSATFFSLIS